MISIPIRPESRDGSELLIQTIEPRVSSTRSPAEFALTKCPLPGEPVTATFERLAAELAAEEAEVLSLFVFGSIAGKREIERAMRDTLGETQWPVTWADGAPCHGGGNPLAGVQAFATSGRSITRVRLRGRVVGSV